MGRRRRKKRHEVPEEREERKKAGSATCISMRLHPSSPLLYSLDDFSFLTSEESLSLLSICDGTSGTQEGLLYDIKPASSYGQTVSANLELN